MLNSRDLELLKRKLPTNWVARVQEKVPFGATKIREALKYPEHYDEQILDAAIEVASEYLEERDAKIQDQKAKIKVISVS